MLNTYPNTEQKSLRPQYNTPGSTIDRLHLYIIYTHISNTITETKELASLAPKKLNYNKQTKTQQSLALNLPNYNKLQVIHRLIKQYNLDKLLTN